MVQLNVSLNALVLLKISDANLDFFQRKITVALDVGNSPPLGVGEILQLVSRSDDVGIYKIRWVRFMSAFGGPEADMDRLQRLLPEGIYIENPPDLRSVVWVPE